MNIKPGLEQELMRLLRNLTEDEQNSIQIFSAMYINSSERIKFEKTTSLEESIVGQIEFYGRYKNEYLQEINEIVSTYSNYIEEIISLYNTWFIAVISKLQDAQNNQKITIVNQKICIGLENEKSRIASKYKFNNYEIIIQECKRQAKECKSEMETKLNEIFYTENAMPATKKPNIFQKIINFFTGKSKIENFVINSYREKMQSLSEKVNDEVNRINGDIVNQIAVIEDANIQTQNIFTNMKK